MPADDASESAEAVDMADAPEEQDASEAAWAGMPDEGWSDDGRWGDDADLDVGQPLHAMPPMESDEPAAQSASGGYVSTAQDAAPVERTAEGDLWFDVVQQLLQSEAVVAVARQLALGLSNKEVARQLDISDHTVHVHRQSITKKTGSGHAADLARLIWRAAPDELEE